MPWCLSSWVSWPCHPAVMPCRSMPSSGACAHTRSRRRAGNIAGLYSSCACCASRCSSQLDWPNCARQVWPELPVIPCAITCWNMPTSFTPMSWPPGASRSCRGWSYSQGSVKSSPPVYSPSEWAPQPHCSPLGHGACSCRPCFCFSLAMLCCCTRNFFFAYLGLYIFWLPWFAGHIGEQIGRL